jgi:NRAMP (natural resistance-associated macrophage protein)-like metal ion transporter
MLSMWQSLAVKLGSVTGMDLAQMNRAYLPRWLNIGLYIVAEAAIVCTDIGQVSLCAPQKCGDGRPQPDERC